MCIKWCALCKVACAYSVLPCLVSCPVLSCRVTSLSCPDLFCVSLLLFTWTMLQDFFHKTCGTSPCIAGNELLFSSYPMAAGSGSIASLGWLARIFCAHFLGLPKKREDSLKAEEWKPHILLTWKGTEQSSFIASEEMRTHLLHLVQLHWLYSKQSTVTHTILLLTLHDQYGQGTSK